MKCRALLDTGATANFITESTVSRLGIPIFRHSSSVGAVGNTSTESIGIARILVRAIRTNFCMDLICLVIPAIADLIPTEIFPRESVTIPSNVQLADPEFHVPRPIDLLIGSGTTLSLFSVGQISLKRGECELYL